ncbi:MAG: ribosomal subunit interface protein [Phycisphaeraceae bacterium]|nr:ribosomal subunit interface protein [Phycisphaeraceae bacterium]
MEFRISGRHVDVSPAIKEYAETKAAKLHRYFDRIQSINIVAAKHDSHSHEVEMIVKVEHADAFVAKTTGNDLYGCIDDVVDKLERQLTDHKEKLRNRKHKT